MHLEISTTHQPATDLGYLLHKNPARVARKETSFGDAMVYYTQATTTRCTAVLTVELDPVRLVRGRIGGDGVLDAYVNDRPYVASSFLASAISEMYGTALNGRSKDRQELADARIPLEAHIPAIRARGGSKSIDRLFAPLGYEVEATPLQLDTEHPMWGDSIISSLTIRGTVRLCDLLRHLYILLPVIDSAQHYWVGDAEVEKLLSKGEQWLATHPSKELITSRYLVRQGSLVKNALSRLIVEEPLPDGAEEESLTDPDGQTAGDAEATGSIETPVAEPKRRLNEIRLEAVAGALLEVHPARVIDLGCGEGKLIASIMRDKTIRELHGMDVSLRTLEIAAARLRLDRVPERLREKVHLFQGSLLYVDKRISGFDAAALVEVIEHIEPSRLGAVERVLFEHARPNRVVITTPNSEYNVRWEKLMAGTMRHDDHRFEWTRAQFQSWAMGAAEKFGYRVEFREVGPIDAEVGSPTQMAVFDFGVAPTEVAE
jgi:3' terminal RNA ribose 2'-O-methyltransferase Hen1